MNDLTQDQLNKLAKTIGREINCNIESQVQEGIETLKLSISSRFDTLETKLTDNLAEVIKYINAKHAKDIEEIKQEITIIKQVQKQQEIRHSIFSWFYEKPVRVAYLTGIIAALAVVIKYI